MAVSAPMAPPAWSAALGRAGSRGGGMARWNLRRTRGQRPPPGFLLAPTAIGGEADLERQHHVDEGLEGDAHEQRSDQIDDVPLLERSCERRDPLLLGAPRLEIAPPQPFELRTEEHTSELQSLMRISYAVFCLKKKKKKK